MAVAVVATTALVVGCGAGTIGTAVSSSRATTTTSVSAALASATSTTSTTTPGTATAPESTTTAVDGSTAPSAVAAAGECITVTFTPSTASVAQLAELCTPSGDVEDTAIVLVHGGAGVSGSRTDLTAWQEWYAEQGYVTLSVDYALVDPDTDTGIYPLAEQNVKAGVQYLRMVGASLGVDSIVIQGNSAGARLAGIVATTGDDASFSGDELWPGVSDAVDGTVGFYGYYDGAQFNGAAYFGGDGAPASTASAIDNAASVSGWTILVHGTADSIVSVTASEDYAAALESVGAEVRLVEIDGAEHGLDGYDTAELTAVGRQLARMIVSTIRANSSA